MTAKRSAVTGRIVNVKQADPKTGSIVRVTFGRHDVTGVVVSKTVTGRYNVKVNVEGADEPITTSYAREELRVQ